MNELRNESKGRKNERPWRRNTKKIDKVLDRIQDTMKFLAVFQNKPAD